MSDCDIKSEAKEVEVRETEMSRIVRKLGTLAEILCKEVSTMETRLNTVVNGGGLKRGTDTSSPKPVEFQTNLAQAINEKLEMIESCTQDLSALRNRIEL